MPYRTRKKPGNTNALLGRDKRAGTKILKEECRFTNGVSFVMMYSSVSYEYIRALRRNKRCLIGEMTGEPQLFYTWQSLGASRFSSASRADDLRFYDGNDNRY